MELRLTGAACVFEGMLPGGAAFALSDDTDRVLFLEVDGSLRWLDLDAEETWPFTTSERVRAVVAAARPRSLRTSPDGRLAALARGGEVVIVRSDSDAVVTLAPLPEDAAVVALLDGGAKVVTGSRAAGRAWVHDAGTGDLLHVFEGAPCEASLDGRHLAVTTRTDGGHHAEVWRAGGELVMRAPIPDAPTVLSFSGDGRWLWGIGSESGDETEGVRRAWRCEVATGARFDADLHDGSQALFPYPDTPHVVLVASSGTLLVLLGDGDDGRVAERDLAWFPSLYSADRVASSPDGRVVVVASADLACRVDLASGDVSCTPLPPYLAVAAPSRDGRLVALAREREIVVLDAASLAVRWRLEGYEGEVRALAFSPAGPLLSVDSRCVLRAWDLSAGVETWALALDPWEGDRVARIACSPCGSWAAVTLLDDRPCTGFVRLDGPSAGTWLPGAAAFLPGEPGSTAAVFGVYRRAPHVIVRTFDVADDVVIRELPHAEPDAPPDGLGRTACPSRDGRFVMVARGESSPPPDGPGTYCLEWESGRVSWVPWRLASAPLESFGGRVAVLVECDDPWAGVRVILFDAASGDVVASSAPLPALRAQAALSHDECVVFVADSHGRLYRFELSPLP